VAFKGDTDDIRFTPTYEIRNELVRKGFEVRLTDPFVCSKDIDTDLYVACKNSNVILILTDHTEYKNIDLMKLKALMNEDATIIDTRGLVNRKDANECGFKYHGLGRL
jgi:UDP-N-acetyl-D-mannosaminuronate dehydrogenase